MGKNLKGKECGKGICQRKDGKYTARYSAKNGKRRERHFDKNGEGDVVVMSVSAFEEREQQLKHQADILEAEFSRLNGEPTYSTKQARDMLKEKYRHAQVQG